MVYYSSSMLGGQEITLAEKAGRVSALFFGKQTIQGGRLEKTALILEAEKQLEEYFQGKRREFHLPLAPEGTAFQHRVWAELQKIPYGETRSYKEIAQQIGNEKACRAVGMANHRNPIPILIPCHRVIGADGRLVGYACGLERKNFLLQLEKRMLGESGESKAQEPVDIEGLRNQIVSLADEKYKKFQSRLLPGIDNYIGVRLPELRRLAQKLAREWGKEYLETVLDRDSAKELFEEIMVQAMVIGYIKADISDILSYTEKFLPKIDNWAVCDSLCSGLKQVLSNRQEVWNWLMKLAESEREFTVRFVAVMLLNYYIDKDYIEKVFGVLDQVEHQGYYAKMAVAWAVSACYKRYPQLTAAYLEHCSLDNFTRRKSRQKIAELRRTT